MTTYAIARRLTQLGVPTRSNIDDANNRKRAREIAEQSLAIAETQNRKDADRLNPLLDLYSGGEIEKAVYLAKKGEIEQAVQRRQTETAELHARLSATANMNPDREAEIRRLKAEIVEKLDGMSLEQKSKLLAMLAVECLYDAETGQVMMTGASGNQQLSLDAEYEDEHGGPSSNSGSQTSTTFESYRRLQTGSWQAPGANRAVRFTKGKDRGAVPFFRVF